MKTVAWLYGGKIGRALMGNIVEETQESYIVIVTSSESKKDKKLEGQQFFVSKSVAQLS